MKPGGRRIAGVAAAAAVAAEAATWLNRSRTVAECACTRSMHPLDDVPVEDAGAGVEVINPPHGCMLAQFGAPHSGGDALSDWRMRTLHALVAVRERSSESDRAMPGSERCARNMPRCLMAAAHLAICKPNP